MELTSAAVWATWVNFGSKMSEAYAESYSKQIKLALIQQQSIVQETLPGHISKYSMLSFSMPTSKTMKQELML